MTDINRAIARKGLHKRNPPGHNNEPMQSKRIKPRQRVKNKGGWLD